MANLLDRQKHAHSTEEKGKVRRSAAYLLEATTSAGWWYQGLKAGTFSIKGFLVPYCCHPQELTQGHLPAPSPAAVPHPVESLMGTFSVTGRLLTPNGSEAQDMTQAWKVKTYTSKARTKFWLSTD